MVCSVNENCSIDKGSESKIEVSNDHRLADHRLADPEPLVKMLEAAEKTSENA